ncbi:MAG: hypothetical protein IT233_00730 [Bacteroidia bacterium]|nr:hypothetical protein [Bacteroidia bacterium]
MNKIFAKISTPLKITFVYIIPLALILNWLLNPGYNLILTNSECIDYSGNGVLSSGSGFPFVSQVGTCGSDCFGADYRTVSYFFKCINGAIMLLLSFLLYYLVLKRVKPKLWQSIVWCFLIYSSFGMYFQSSMDFIRCGTFGYDEITAIHFRFDVYRLLNGFEPIVFFGNYFLLALPMLVAFLIFKDHKKKDSQVSKWWFLFYIYWSVFFFIVLVFEWWLARFNDQMITSSGDWTFRQHWISILIGYALVITLFTFARRLLLRKKKYSVLFAIAFSVISLLITIKNQHCIVFGSNGSRFVEFYTPFYESQSIGCWTQRWDNPLEKLNPPFENKNILKIHTKENHITFERPIVGDYKITKQFLFWRFDFPEVFEF